MLSKKLIKVAIITDAHGIKGEVKLRGFVENPEFFTTISTLFDSTGKKNFSVKVTGKIKNGVIIKIDGVESRNSAELLKNTELFAPASLLPVLDDGEFYHSQLIALEARLEDGEVVGKVVAIHNYGAGDIAEITKENGEAEMLPLHAPWVTEINIEHGYIIVILAEYL
ncbi:MAG: ribosome maturation factor RimM [Rickettsiales bacterium]|jgi:16S rRNA processing protein RimM